MSKVFVIAQGGGPTAVINQTVAGAAIAARSATPARRSSAPATASAASATATSSIFLASPRLTSAALAIRRTRRWAPPATSRTPHYCARILEQLKESSADAFIYIGGNDTAGTLQILNAAGGSRDGLRPCAKDDRQRSRRERPHAGLHLGRTFRQPRVPVDGPRFPRPPRHLRRHRHGPPRRLPHRRRRRMAARRTATARTSSTSRSAISRRRSSSPTSAPSARNTAAASSPCRKASPLPTVDPWSRAWSVKPSSATPMATCSFPPATSASPSRPRLSKAFPKVRARVDTFGYLPRAFSASDQRIDRREAFEVGAYAVTAAENGSASVALGNETGANTDPRRAACTPSPARRASCRRIFSNRPRTACRPKASPTSRGFCRPRRRSSRHSSRMERGQ